MIDAEYLLDQVSSWQIELTRDAELAHDALTIALQRRHSVYDCCYLALAQKLGAALISADKKLLGEAEDLGLRILAVASK